MIEKVGKSAKSGFALRHVCYFANIQPKLKDTIRRTKLFCPKLNQSINLKRNMYSIWKPTRLSTILRHPGNIFTLNFGSLFARSSPVLHSCVFIGI